MTTCPLCGKQMELNEEHFHNPDFALNVHNCQWSLMQYFMIDGKLRARELNFNVPEKWANFILETCGGAINISGVYRLPGIIWEWVLAKCRNDEQTARFIEEKVNSLIEKYNK